MPAQSTSLILSTSVYLLSSALFLGIAYVPVQGSLRASTAAMIRNIAEGLELRIDALDPGTSATLSWRGPGLGPPVSVRLEGHTVAVTAGGISFQAYTHWALPSIPLEKDREYRMSISGERVILEAKGFS